MLKELKNLLKAEIDPAFAERATYIFSELETTNPKRVLDVGCGRGFYLTALANYSFIDEICGIDIKTTYLAVARKNNRDKRVHMLPASIYELPYEDSSFDFIICSEVLEHLENDSKALQEIHRVLKKNGTLVITVPNRNFPFLWDPLNWLLMRLVNTHINKDIWWLAGIWADHERLYTVDEIKQKVQRMKFSIKHIATIVKFCWPFSHFLLYGIGKNLIEYLGAKQFSRFSQSPSNASVLLAKIFRFPTMFKRKTVSASVSILLTATK